MDEKAVGFMGAVAAFTVLRRGLRPATKTAMKGYLAIVDATGDIRRELGDMYAEAQDEYRAGRRESQGGSEAAESASAHSAATSP